METKFKVNEKVYFLWDGGILDGKIEGIEITIPKDNVPRIRYDIKFRYNMERNTHMNEFNIFKTKCFEEESYAILILIPLNVIPLTLPV